MKFIDLEAQQAAIKPELDRRIAAVLAHGQYIMGPEVAELEAVLVDFVGVRHCVTTASGTDALLIALMALGVGPGDEVITTPFSFAATAEVIVLVGAKPVFVDVEPDTGNIDASLIDARITKRTKVIMPVSLYGQPADMATINAIAARYGGIPVIEDAAQSFGATFDGRRSCGLSTIGCTSFFPSKPLGCYGDGGALFTDDDALAKAAREIRVHGQSERYVHTRIGVGGRMDTLQSAIVLAKWPRFAWEVGQRQEIGRRYGEMIRERSRELDLNERAATRTVETVRPLALKEGRRSVFAQYSVLVPERDIFRRHLADSGIPTAVHYPLPLNWQPAYRHLCCPECTPVAEWLSRHVVSLPMSADLKPNDQVRVIDTSFAIPPLVASLGGQHPA